MRSRLFALLALTAALVTACGSTNRPEGVVERWLLALNDGKAGRPELYAPDALSQRILPGWRTKDPGQLDTIEVGRSYRGLYAPRFQGALVPFRVVRHDGSEINGTAALGRSTDPPENWRIDAIRGHIDGREVPSRGGRPIALTSFKTWLAALGVAVALALISVGLMTLVGKRPEPLATFPLERKT